MDYLAAILLMFTGLFLIMLVLVQRGRGGGLAGAFGGMGGSSAFGTKAGDVFTKITVIAAVVWVILAGLSILAFTAKSGGNYSGGDDAAGASVSAIDDEGDLDSTEKDKATEKETEKESDAKKPDAKPEEPTTTEKPSSESTNETKEPAPESSENSKIPE